MTAPWITGRALRVLALLSGLIRAGPYAARDAIEDAFIRYAAAHPNLALALTVSYPCAGTRIFAAGPVRSGAEKMATAAERWHIRYVAKAFVATLALQLAERCAFDLHAPIGTYLTSTERLRDLARERCRFGYRRLGILLESEAFYANHNKTFRLYREKGFAARRQRGRKRAVGSRRPILIPAAANHRWSLDFVSDSRVDRRRLRTLCVVDASLSGVRVARELDRLIERRGKPRINVSDNGAELTSHAILRWLKEQGVDLDYIAPGKPA